MILDLVSYNYIKHKVNRYWKKNSLQKFAFFVKEIIMLLVLLFVSFAMSIESLQTSNKEELKQFDIDQLEKVIWQDIQHLKADIMFWPEKEKNTLRQVELQKDGKVNIPYDRDGKKYDIIAQKIGKTVKLSVEVNGKEVAKLDKLSISWNADLRKYVGNLLDSYITDKNRKPIPEKVDRAYELLEAQDLISAYNIKIDQEDKEVKVPFSIMFDNSSSGQDIYEYDIILTKNGVKVEWEIDVELLNLHESDIEYKPDNLNNILTKIQTWLEDKAWNFWKQTPNIEKWINATKKVFTTLFQ